MKIIEYFTSENKKHWLDEMKICDWGAGQYLHHLLSENSLKRSARRAFINQTITEQVPADTWLMRAIEQEAPTSKSLI